MSSRTAGGGIFDEVYKKEVFGLLGTEQIKVQPRRLGPFSGLVGRGMQLGLHSKSQAPYTVAY